MARLTKPELPSLPQCALCRAVQCTLWKCSAVQCSAVQCSAVQCSAAQYHCAVLGRQTRRRDWKKAATKKTERCGGRGNLGGALHCTALHCTALHCTALHCTALHRREYLGGAPALPVSHTVVTCTARFVQTALHCTALHCTALHCTVHCTALHTAQCGLQ
jgi:hypothetical protein